MPGEEASLLGPWNESELTSLCRPQTYHCNPSWSIVITLYMLNLLSCRFIGQYNTVFLCDQRQRSMSYVFFSTAVITDRTGSSATAHFTRLTLRPRSKSLPWDMFSQDKGRRKNWNNWIKNKLRNILRNRLFLRGNFSQNTFCESLGFEVSRAPLGLARQVPVLLFGADQRSESSGGSSSQRFLCYLWGAKVLVSSESDVDRVLWWVLPELGILKNQRHRDSAIMWQSCDRTSKLVHSINKLRYCESHESLKVDSPQSTGTRCVTFHVCLPLSSPIFVFLFRQIFSSMDRAARAALLRHGGLQRNLSFENTHRANL